MDDVEMTRRCAKVAGIEVTEIADHAGGPSKLWCDFRGVGYQVYDPLHDDAQAMALVKKFKLHPIPDNDREGYWDVFVGKPYSPTVYGSDPDLNRAICTCVAKMVPHE